MITGRQIGKRLKRCFLHIAHVKDTASLVVGQKIHAVQLGSSILESNLDLAL
jgi:hypothetical protein